MNFIGARLYLKKLLGFVTCLTVDEDQFQNVVVLLDCRQVVNFGYRYE